MIIKVFNRQSQVKCIRDGVKAVDRTGSGTYTISYEDDRVDEKISNVKDIDVTQELKMVEQPTVKGQ